MFRSHKNLELPPHDAKLWRYMDLTKLLGIIATGTLRFSHLSQFDDKYKGYVPIPSIEQTQDTLRNISKMFDEFVALSGDDGAELKKTIASMSHG